MNKLGLRTLELYSLELLFWEYQITFKLLVLIIFFETLLHECFLGSFKVSMGDAIPILLIA
jgi:hypothetical protein